MKRKLFFFFVFVFILFDVIAQADIEYMFIDCYQRPSNALQIVECSNICIVDDFGVAHIDSALTVENTTSRKCEYIGATLLVADEKELDRLDTLSQSEYILEMLRRNFKREEDMIYDWYVRVDPKDNLAVPRYIEPGERIYLQFEIEARPFNEKEMVLLFQECSIAVE